MSRASRTTGDCIRVMYRVGDVDDDLASKSGILRNIEGCLVGQRKDDDVGARNGGILGVQISPPGFDLCQRREGRWIVRLDQIMQAKPFDLAGGNFKALGLPGLYQ